MYNKALFVETAINSVLRQSHTDFEIIVIDDGSHDHGANLVKGFTDERIQLVQQPNGGVSRARNRGIALAKGELICFLDADDWYEANYLETIVSLATTHPEIGLFASSFRRVPLKSGFPIPSQALDSSRTIEVIDDLYDRWRRQGAFFARTPWQYGDHCCIPCNPVFRQGNRWARTRMSGSGFQKNHQWPTAMLNLLATELMWKEVFVQRTKCFFYCRYMSALNSAR